MELEQELLKIQSEIKENNLSWEAGETPYTGLPEKLAKKILGYDFESEGTTAEEEELKSKKNLETYQSYRTTSGALAVPDVTDWRNYQGKSYVTKVKNQGTCGSCVSFATVGAIESIARLHAKSPDPSPVLPLLSEASLHFCAGKKCNGWNLSAALQFCQSTGVVPDSYFPYDQVAKPCEPKPEWEAARTKVKSYHTISSIDDMIKWLAEKGPLATRFNVYSDFYNYKKGIYRKTPSAKEQGGHAVLCVGYDKQNQAWICKNSWKDSWGEKGYFRIAMGECGIDATMYAIDALLPEYPLYMDVMMRDGLNDFGQTPVSGNICASPDIVPVGLDALTEPEKTLTEQWFQDIGTNLVENANNVIYLRGISHNPQATKAKFYLYYSPASLLMYPNQWKDNLILCSNGQEYFETDALGQGDLAITKEPYIWNPSGIENDHYCLIGRVVTSEHPNPIPEPKDIKEFTKFVADNPNYCMRNIALVDKDVPDYSVAIQYEQGELGADMHFIIENFGCSPDAEFSLSCTNPSSTAPICMARQKVPADGRLTGICVAVPKDFKAQLLLNFWNSHPEKAKDDWSLQLKAFYIPDTEELDEIANTVMLSYGSIGPEKAVLLGAYTIKATKK